MKPLLSRPNWDQLQKVQLQGFYARMREYAYVLRCLGCERDYIATSFLRNKWIRKQKFKSYWYEKGKRMNYGAWKYWSAVLFSVVGNLKKQKTNERIGLNLSRSALSDLKHEVIVLSPMKHMQRVL